MIVSLMFSLLAIRMRMKIASVGQRSPSPLFRKAVASVFLLCVAICCAPSSSVAADSSTVIRLSVIDEKNLPVPNATVQVRLGEKLVSTASTDAAGKVTVNTNININVPGTYSLGVQKKGYLATETAVEVRDGSAAQDIEVMLSTVAPIKQSVEVKGEASNPITDTPLRPATLVDTLPLIPLRLRRSQSFGRA